MKIPTIMPGAEPFFYRGGTIGCLCLHGIMASPAEIRWLGDYLSGCGFTVYGPRLPGHGTFYRDLSRLRWTDWYAAALDGYHLLRGQCQQVTVIGHSMGGLLALLLASQQPVDAVAALAAPVRLKQRAAHYARWLKYILPYTDQTDRSNLPDLIRAEQQRRGEVVTGRVRYDRWASAAVGELYVLGRVVEAQLPGVKAPLLLVYSMDDQTVSADNLELIAGRVSSQTIERHLINGSDHILTQDRQRETVFGLVGDFVAKLEP